MKGFKKFAVALGVASVMAASLGTMAGCGEPAVENLGTYSFTQSTVRAIEYGGTGYWVMNTVADTIAVKSDNTFEVKSDYQWYASDNGKVYNRQDYLSYGVYGTYEIVSEDKDLNEMTIKIVDVTAFWSNQGEESDKYKLFNKGSFPTGGQDEANNKITNRAIGLIGKQFILGGDYTISETLKVASSNGSDTTYN